MRRLWRRILMAFSAVVIVCAVCLNVCTVSASYVSDHAGNAQELEQIRTLYEATSRCLGSSERKSMTISLSSSDRSGSNQYMKNFYNLNSASLFEAKKGSGGSNLIYSAVLENQASGYDDGKIYCSELNLLPELLSKLGQYTDSTRNNLICNGSQPGLFSVTTGYGGQMFGAKYDNDKDGQKDWPAGWPAQNDCSGNLALLIEYIEQRPNESIRGSGNGNYDYPFNVKIEPSANAASHFQSIVSPLVGRFDELDTDTRKTMDYWRYYQAFEIGCGAKVNNGNTNPPAASSTNMNAIYDAVTKKVYYHSDSEINSSRNIYYNVKDSSQLTCKDLAEKLGEDAAKIALATQHADVEDCIARYNEALDKFKEQIQKYNSLRTYANNLKSTVSSKITEIRNGKFEPTYTSYGAPEYTDIKKFAQDTVRGLYYSRIHAGVDGKNIYNDNLLDTIVSAFENIADNIEMSDNKTDILSKPSDETLNEFDNLLTQWQAELDRVESEINSAQNLLDEKRALVGSGENSSRGEVWDFSDETLLVTCPGLDSLDKEIANILSGAPPDIDTSWSGVTVDRPDQPSGGGGDATDIDQCYGSAGALGWILCPVINFVSTATDSIYNDYIQSEFLEVKSNNLTTGSDLYKSWQAVRNIANILFIIMFIIVVLSQITGLGISNYGIKKLLPRLIVVAVLVNISFLLCQFAVDISNVLGYGLNDIFTQLAPGVNNGLGTLGSVGSGVASALTWAGIVGIAISTAGSWLIPLLLALLSAIISVLFGGIILGLRQAGIIVLIVLAPVAIVCYALPNAKSIYDRWFKMFSSLLMVFPICGALMGGGYFASNLIASTTSSVLLNIIAMLIRVAPFFMIPSLTRTSMMAIGNIGNKVANWGNKMGRTATGAIAKSDFVRQRDADLAKFQGDMTAKRGRMLNRVLKKDPNELSDRRKAKVARQYAKYNKLRGEEATAFPYAMSQGSREYTAAQNAAHQKRISTLADNIAAENADAATNYEELEKRLDAAMVAYNESGSDEDLASIHALNNMLIGNGDKGISSIQNSLGRATEAGLSKSVQAMGQHLIGSHTKDIKPVARELFGAAGAAAAGELQQGSFTQDRDGMYTSLNHLSKSIGGYDASSIGKMNETSLDRMINNAGELKNNSDFVRTFDLLSSNSLTNPNIHVQPKVAEKMNKLRGALGLTQLANNSGANSQPNPAQGGNPTDSGRIQLQGNGNNSRNGGTIVRTGNDDRLPSPLRGAEDWQRDSSGIILSPDARAQRQRDRQNSNSDQS